MWANRTLAIGLLAALVVGCGGSKAAPEEPAQRVNVVQPGAPGEPTKRVAPGATPAQVQHTQADVEFMQGMIHHHQQALTMTDWVPDRTRSTSIRLIARRMELSQQAEIDQMWKWLEARGVDPADHSHEHTAMPGMLNSRQLERLDAPTARRFDELFLRYMTQHHRGALTMVAAAARQGRRRGGRDRRLHPPRRRRSGDRDPAHAALLTGL